MVRLGLALALLLVVPVPRPAAAGDEGGGHFSWRPSLRVTALADDNALLESGKGDGSLGGWIAPRLELAWRSPALELGAEGGPEARQYGDEAGTLNDEFYRAVGWAELGLSRGLSLRASNAFVPQPVRLGLPEDQTQNRVQTNRSELALRWWRELSHERELEMGVVASHLRSDGIREAVPQPGGGVAIDDDFRANYSEALAFAELQGPLVSWLRGFVRGQASYRELHQFSDGSHSNLSMLLGVRSRSDGPFWMRLAGGVGTLGFDGLADELRALGEAAVGARFWGHTQVWLRAVQGLTPNLAGEDLDESRAELGVERSFGPATAVAATLFVSRVDGDLRAPGSNLFGALELRLRRQLTRNLQAGVSYRHWRNRGDFQLDDFSQNRVALELTVHR